MDTEAVAAGEATPEQTRAETILLTVPPQDALVLKYAIDAGGTLSFALRAPTTTARTSWSRWIRTMSSIAMLFRSRSANSRPVHRQTGR